MGSIVVREKLNLLKNSKTSWNPNPRPSEQQLSLYDIAFLVASFPGWNGMKTQGMLSNEKLHRLREHYCSTTVEGKIKCSHLDIDLCPHDFSLSHQFIAYIQCMS